MHCKNMSETYSICKVFPNECKQLKKDNEPIITKAKAWCFSTSEIKISCYT